LAAEGDDDRHRRRRRQNGGTEEDWAGSRQPPPPTTTTAATDDAVDDADPGSIGECIFLADDDATAAAVENDDCSPIAAPKTENNS
jgi:hypothetical protein